jgi:putative flippase GtrA
VTPPLVARWVKFNAVGAIGIVVQLAALALYRSVFGWNYLAATAAAVETAILHNFLWHERWTWRDRTERSELRHSLGRLLRFNLSTGAVSIGFNLVCMRVLVGHFHVQFLVANLLSIAAGSLANFLLGERFVFRG